MAVGNSGISQEVRARVEVRVRVRGTVHGLAEVRCGSGKSAPVIRYGVLIAMIEESFAMGSMYQLTRCSGVIAPDEQSQHVAIFPERVALTITAKQQIALPSCKRVPGWMGDGERGTS